MANVNGLVLLTAYHAKDVFFGKTLELKPSTLLKTHVEIGHKTVPNPALKGTIGEWKCLITRQVLQLAEDAFFYFNWQSTEHAGYAGPEVNAICKYSGTHASMSVGDVVKIQWQDPPSGKHSKGKMVTAYFKCAAMGFEELKSTRRK